MTNQNGIWMRRVRWASFVFLAFFLFGCGSARGAPGGKPAQPASMAAIEAGNVENGRKLFLGYVHFQNGGPPCMGCHSVGNNGLLGGGAMGPDLTDVSTRVNQTGLVSILSNYGPKSSPVMQPIYIEHPLTAGEQADLIAFLNASAGQPESNKEIWVFGISLAGLAAAVGALGFIYRGRLRSIRGALVNRAQKEML